MFLQKQKSGWYRVLQSYREPGCKYPKHKQLGIFPTEDRAQRFIDEHQPPKPPKPRKPDIEAARAVAPRVVAELCSHDQRTIGAELLKALGL